MKCMTVEEIDELLEQMSKKNQEEFEENTITETKINPNIDKELHELLKEAERLFEEKSNKEEYVEDGIFCSF